MPSSMDCAGGLIPARAGTTVRCWQSFLVSGAHPRSRGDHVRVTNKGTGESGSSPLARGPRNALGQVIGALGLIPARAGTTWRAAIARLLSWAHPRSRGDHLGHYIYMRVCRGSSPLARGPLLNFIGDEPAIGLIPARAGTTESERNINRDTGAHPRSRGDHMHIFKGIR